VGSDDSLPGIDGGRQDSSDVYRESRDIWDDYNKRQEFEHKLIDRKTTWWATAQTILFAAYGMSWQDPAANGAPKFRCVVAIAGVVVAIVTLVGVLGVIRSKCMSWKAYRLFYKENEAYLPRPLRGKPLQLSTAREN
jgi:hypothetical protein